MSKRKGDFRSKIDSILADDPPDEQPKGGTSTGLDRMFGAEPRSSGALDRMLAPTTETKLDEIDVARIKLARGRRTDADKDLVESVGRSGILQPLLLRSSGGGFEVLDGGRRLAIARQAGLKTVPAVVRTISDAEARAMAAERKAVRADRNIVAPAPVAAAKPGPAKAGGAPPRTARAVPTSATAKVAAVAAGAAAATAGARAKATAAPAATAAGAVPSRARATSRRVAATRPSAKKGASTRGTTTPVSSSPPTGERAVTEVAAAKTAATTAPRAGKRTAKPTRPGAAVGPVAAADETIPVPAAPKVEREAAREPVVPPKPEPEAPPREVSSPASPSRQAAATSFPGREAAVEGRVAAASASNSATATPSRGREFLATAFIVVALFSLTWTVVSLFYGHTDLAMQAAMGVVVGLVLFGATFLAGRRS